MGNNCCGHNDNKEKTGCCGGHNHHESHEGCCGGHNHHEAHEGCCGGHEHHEGHEGCCGGHGHDHGHDHHGCGCGEHEHEAMFVELEDENGNVMECEVVDGFLFEENEYALVQNPEDGSIYLFKIVGDEEVGELVVPEDDEYDAAKAYYERMIAEENSEN